VTVLKTGGMDYYPVLKASFFFRDSVCSLSGDRSTQQKKTIQRARSISDGGMQRTWIVGLPEHQKGNSHVIMANRKCSSSLVVLD